MYNPSKLAHSVQNKFFKCCSWFCCWRKEKHI